MRTVTVSHNWYSFPRCSGIAVPTDFGALSDVSCRDRGRACQAWSGLVGMEVELGHSLTVRLMLQMPIVILFPMAFTSQNNIEFKVGTVVCLWVP